MDDDRELLKEKAVLLLSRERELLTLKNVAKRLQRWLSMAQRLPEFVHGTADDNKVLDRVSRALISALQFQSVLFFEKGRHGLVRVGSESHEDAACSVPSATEAEQFLRAQPRGACNAPDAQTQPLADAVGLHRFLWHSLSLSDTDELLLVAGYDSATARFYRGFTAEDQAQFHHMGEQLVLLLANQRLLHNLAAEKQRLAEFNRELEARVLDRTEMLTSANNLLQNTLTELQDRNQRIAADLEQARRFQQKALPAMPAPGRFDFAVAFLPLDAVGGDVYDVCELAPDHYRLFIADAPGHGVQAAMRTLLLKAEYDRLKLTCSELPELFARFNRRLLELFPEGEMLCTACAIDVRAEGRHVTVSYVNAAHCPVLHCSGGMCEQVYMPSSFLGLSDGAWADCTRFRLEGGDLLLLATDGLTEQVNERREMFEPQLVDVAATPSGSALGKVSSVMQAFSRHRGTVALGDDLTLLCVRFSG